jgi:hypothetical protein
MFHLLIKYIGWAQARDSITLDRIFEYTDANISQRFKAGDSLDQSKVMLFPALFVSETNGPGPQQARVGTITRVGIGRTEVNLEYTYDADIPPIENTALGKLAKELMIEPFEFSRTHWAIKDADLFRVLLRHHLSGIRVPKVFRLNESATIEADLVSVMMPFDNRFDEVYTTLQHTAGSLKIHCLRADDIWENEAIIQDIVSLIYRSRIVICDCTGRNPNVFYEIGIAHTLGRNVILITQSDSDIPFDLRHLRYIHYLNNGEGLQQLSELLAQRIQTLVN